MTRPGFAAHHPARVKTLRGGVADHGFAMGPTQNWFWVLLTLVVWVGMFFAFLLIAIARP